MQLWMQPSLHIGASSVGSLKRVGEGQLAKMQCYEGGTANRTIEKNHQISGRVRSKT